MTHCIIIGIIIGAVAMVALAGLGVALYSIKLTHDQIRDRDQHLAAQVDAALRRQTRIVR